MINPILERVNSILLDPAKVGKTKTEKVAALAISFAVLYYSRGTVHGLMVLLNKLGFISKGNETLNFLSIKVRKLWNQFLWGDENGPISMSFSLPGDEAFTSRKSTYAIHKRQEELSSDDSDDEEYPAVRLVKKVSREQFRAFVAAANEVYDQMECIGEKETALRFKDDIQVVEYDKKDSPKSVKESIPFSQKLS